MCRQIRSNRPVWPIIETESICNKASDQFFIQLPPFKSPGNNERSFNSSYSWFLWMDGCLYVITIIKDFCSFEAIWDLASRWAAATTGCRLSANCPKIVCTDFCNNPETETNAITYHSIRAENVWTRHRAPSYLDLIHSALFRTVAALLDYKTAEIIICKFAFILWFAESFRDTPLLIGWWWYKTQMDSKK